MYTFIVLTVGLLVYAGVRPYVDKRGRDVQGSARYAPLSSMSEGAGGR